MCKHLVVGSNPSPGAMKKHVTLVMCFFIISWEEGFEGRETAKWKARERANCLARVGMRTPERCCANFLVSATARRWLGRMSGSEWEPKPNPSPHRVWAWGSSLRVEDRGQQTRYERWILKKICARAGPIAKPSACYGASKKQEFLFIP